LSALVALGESCFSEEGRLCRRRIKKIRSKNYFEGKKRSHESPKGNPPEEKDKESAGKFLKPFKKRESWPSKKEEDYLQGGVNREEREEREYSSLPQGSEGLTIGRGRRGNEEARRNRLPKRDIEK